MSLCHVCGNEVALATLGTVNAECGPVCLVCQHKGRDSGKAMEAHARGLAAALDATYKVLGSVLISDEELAANTVKEAQESLSIRISDQQHSRERPNWEEIDAEKRERQEVCQTCLGTRRYLTLLCPDCQE